MPVSSEFWERAAMRYRKQYDLWHMYEPPFFARSPVDASRGGPRGFCSGGAPRGGLVWDVVQ